MNNVSASEKKLSDFQILEMVFRPIAKPEMLTHFKKCTGNFPKDDEIVAVLNNEVESYSYTFLGFNFHIVAKLTSWKKEVIRYKIIIFEWDSITLDSTAQLIKTFNYNEKIKPLLTRSPDDNSFLMYEFLRKESFDVISKPTLNELDKLLADKVVGEKEYISLVELLDVGLNNMVGICCSDYIKETNLEKLLVYNKNPRLLWLLVRSNNPVCRLRGLETLIKEFEDGCLSLSQENKDELCKLLKSRMDLISNCCGCEHEYFGLADFFKDGQLLKIGYKRKK